MEHVLPLLVANARTARDQQRLLAVEAAAALQQAGTTMARLQQFRSECLARAPGRQGQAADSRSLSDYQGFVERLDQAIAMQRAQQQLRQQLCEAAQAQLLERQQRLMAFEMLGQRRAAERARTEQRREQRQCDEYAARTARLAREPSE